MPNGEPDRFEPQDWLIIAEALASWGGPPNAVETPREECAWELIDAIAADQGLRPAELVRQIDQDWRGPD